MTDYNELEALRRRCDELEARHEVLKSVAAQAVARHEEAITVLAERTDRPAPDVALTRRVEQLEGDLQAELARRVQAAKPATTDRQHETLRGWVEAFFVNCYARSAHGDTKWCGRWDLHFEAVERLTALWYAWEDCWPGDKRERAVWFAQYADSIARDLMSPDGTFKGCTRDRHQQPIPLPSVRDS